MDSFTLLPSAEKVEEPVGAAAPDVTASFRHRHVGFLGVVATVLLVLGTGIGVGVGFRGRTGSAVAATGEAVQLRTMDIIPRREQCADPDMNCLLVPMKCCMVTGHTCFMKDAHHGYCRESCKPGWNCGTPGKYINVAPVVYEPGTSMYCFSVYTQNNGGTKKNWELDLLRTQLQRGASIFGCGAWDVYSDVDVVLSPGPPTELRTHQVFDVENEFHILKRPDGNGWVNTPMFYQVWKEIRHVGRWERKDWTVKVDPDSVFIPQRLVDHLKSKGVTTHGVYFEHCKGVDSGFFGSLEIFSNTAFHILMQKLEDCKYNLCWKGGCGWKYGPWGEDLFAQRCMDWHGVEKAQDFELTTDGACADDRPTWQKWNKHWVPNCHTAYTAVVHPFKNPSDYFTCLDTIMKR